MKRKFFVLTILVFASFAYCEEPASENATDEPISCRAEAKRVAGKLSCPCGCGKMLVDSGSAEQELARIEILLAQKKTEDEIIATYVEKYGKWILAVPPARGINIIVWILPFAGAVVGFFLLWIAIRRLTRAKTSPEEKKTKTSALANTEEAEEELRRFEF